MITATRQESRRKAVIRLLLAGESASFVLAALVHFGVLVPGYAHPLAPLAESVIAVVLLGGLAATWAWPAHTRSIGLAAQGFALLGTLVGLFTIAVGIGPRTTLDLVFHAAILVILASGLVFTGRTRPSATAPGPIVRTWAVDALRAATYLALVLVFAQAVLAGEWLAGTATLMRVHSLNGLAILSVALVQVILVLFVGLGGRPRLLLIAGTGVFFVLVLVQEALGYAGFAAGNQARALHLPNGLLIFGLALANAQLARGLPRSAAEQERVREPTTRGAR